MSPSKGDTLFCLTPIDRAARPERPEGHFARHFPGAVNVVGHGPPVEGQRGYVPRAGRVGPGAIEQRERILAVAEKRVQRPGSIWQHSRFEKRAVARGHLLDVKEALFGLTVFGGIEDDLDGEGFQTGKRVHVEEEAVALPVELDCRPDWCLNDPRRSFDRHRVPADALQVVQAPRYCALRAFRVARVSRAQPRHP